MIFNSNNIDKELSLSENADLLLHELTSINNDLEKIAAMSKEYSEEFKLDQYKDADEKKISQKASKAIEKGNKILSNILVFGGMGVGIGGSFLPFAAPILGFVVCIVGIICSYIGVFKEQAEIKNIANDAKTTIRLLRKIRDKLKPGTKEYEKIDDCIQKLSDKIEAKINSKS